jgi:hypothetical protein
MNGAENWESVATVDALQKIAQSFLRVQKMTQRGISSRVKELNSAHVLHCLSGRCNTTVPLWQSDETRRDVAMNDRWHK